MDRHESMNCIGEEAKVDSAKTEESKYWFPSHARKRSENIMAESTTNLLRNAQDQRVIKKFVANVDLG
jgi:hypothetical protein